MVLGFDETSPHWFAIYVKSKHEKTVASSLERKGHETLLPTYRKLDERRRSFDFPLFPGYVFCRFAANLSLNILKVKGIFYIVSHGSSPAPIPSTEIESLRSLMATQLPVRPWPYFAPGQTISIDYGPFRGMTGVIVDDTNDRWLVVSVHILRRSVAVKIERVRLTA